MNDYQPNPTLLREIKDVARIEQIGDVALLNGKTATITTAATVLASKEHYFRTAMPAVVAGMERGEIAAVVHANANHGTAFATSNGATTYIVITPEQFAKGEAERARYAAWIDGNIQDERKRQAEERAYDLANNEGGEGYNPHRTGSVPTYARVRRHRI